MGDIDIILYDKKKKRYISRNEQRKWRYGIKGGSVNEVTGCRKVYKCTPKKDVLLKHLEYIPLTKYAEIDFTILELKIYNLTLTIRENKDNPGGMIYCGYTYDYSRKHIACKEYLYSNESELKTVLKNAINELNEKVEKMKKCEFTDRITLIEQLARNGYGIYLCERKKSLMKELFIEDNIDYSKYEIIQIDDAEMRVKLRESEEKEMYSVKIDENGTCIPVYEKKSLIRSIYISESKEKVTMFSKAWNVMKYPDGRRYDNCPLSESDIT